MSAFDYCDLARLCPDAAIRVVAVERGMVPGPVPERPQSWFNDKRGTLRQARYIRAEACHRCGKHPATWGGVCDWCANAAKNARWRNATRATRRRQMERGEKP